MNFDLSGLLGNYTLDVPCTVCVNGDLLELSAGTPIKALKADNDLGKVLVDINGNLDWWLDTSFKQMTDKKATKAQ